MSGHLGSILSLASLPLDIQGLLEKVTYAPTWCHCKLMASNRSRAFSEASCFCYVSSVTSSPKRSPPTSSRSPFSPSLRKGGPSSILFHSPFWIQQGMCLSSYPWLCSGSCTLPHPQAPQTDHYSFYSKASVLSLP